MSPLATTQGKEHALEALKARRKKYADSDWSKKTRDLPAGALMYFGCRTCNGPIEVLENWVTRTHYCEECFAMIQLGWSIE